jgi:hypothetical protein
VVIKRLYSGAAYKYSDSNFYTYAADCHKHRGFDSDPYNQNTYPGLFADHHAYTDGRYAPARTGLEFLAGRAYRQPPNG